MIGATSVYVVEGAAIITGALLAIRRREHLPVALLLGFGLALDIGGEAIGESPEGWRFALRMALGCAYPWAVLAVTSLTLRGEGSERLGSKAASHPEAETRTRQSAGVQPARRFIAISPGARLGGIVEEVPQEVASVAYPRQGHVLGSQVARHGDLTAEKEVDLGRRWSLGIALKGAACLAWIVGAVKKASLRARRSVHARILAPVAALFLCYLAALLSSGLRGPALAWCYAGAQAGLAVAMGWRMWGWRRGQGQVRAATATEACAIVCAATEAAQVPAYIGLPSWWSARAVYAFCYLALLFIHGHALLGGSPACLPSTSST